MNLVCNDLYVLPVLGFVDVHAAVVPGELLPGFNALILCCELAGSIILQLLDVVVELVDGDGWVGEHARGLEVHASQLHRVGGSDDAGVGHVKP